MSGDDPGTRPMFYDRQKVGGLAVRPADLRRGTPSSLFKVLVAAAMFQRQRDVQVMRILRDLPAKTAREIGSLGRLDRLARESGCPHLGSNQALIADCDLRKERGRGTCGVDPARACYLKRHTEDLRRYGHFGKVPTSIALMIRQSGAVDLRDLRRSVLRSSSSEFEAASRLESAVSQAWRVNQKIACMFLSAVANPDLGDAVAPWADGVDWNEFVVVDSNVDRFLTAIKYSGPWTYDSRRRFLQALARRVDLSEHSPSVSAFNARLVQQAAYLFMSSANRRGIRGDCMHARPEACASCEDAVRSICPERAWTPLPRVQVRAGPG